MKTIYASFIVCVLSGMSSVASAQECPTFPARGVEIIDTFLQSPANVTLAKGNDDQRRQLTKMIAEQMKYDLGNWSIKSADSRRPQSKDSLALPMGIVDKNMAFCNWDWQSGTTRLRSIDQNTHGEYLADQHLLPTAAVNHLGATAPPVPLPPVADDARLVAMEAQLATIAGAVLELRNAIAGVAAQVAQAQAQADTADSDIRQHAADLARIDAYLANKPIAVKCSASVLGIPVSCRLE